jgi:hypothetical protein
MSHVVAKISSPIGGSTCGRRGLPASDVAILAADYARLGSLEKVGAVHGRSRQSIYQIFKAHGVARNARRDAKPTVEHGGRKFTLDDNGYYRETAGRGRAKARHGREVMLHRIIWEEHNGKIPAGHWVVFRDHNRLNCAIENLLCLSRSRAQSHISTGRNQHLLSAGSRFSTLLNNFTNGHATVATALKR